MDRRLGRPLPHQLPNPTRADPPAINLSSLDRIRYYSQFPRAIPNQRARSHALLTRPPLDPKIPLDLHVLGLPPAFVLSQDQTLKLKCATLAPPLRYLSALPHPRRPAVAPGLRILDVRTSAHIVLPARKDTSVCRASCSKGTATPPNSEADTRIIGSLAQT